MRLFAPSSSLRWVCLTASLLVLGVTAPVRAQFTLPGLGESETPSEPAPGLPREVPADLIEPQLLQREGPAEKFARIFNAELRDVEERQQQIVEQLKLLPDFRQTALKPVEFGYHSGISRTRPKWVQVDLGETVSPDAVAVTPVTVALDRRTEIGYGFPRSFRLDISDDAEFRTYETMAEYRAKDRNEAREAPFFAEVSGMKGRYVRLTAFQLWQPGEGRTGAPVLALGELFVLKGDRNLAAGRPVRSLDTAEQASLWSRAYLTDGRTSLGLPHRAESSPSSGFQSQTTEKTKESWVQIDLEESVPVNEIRLIPAIPEDFVFGLSFNFPLTFRVEISDNPDMLKADKLAQFVAGQLTEPGNNPVVISVKETPGRYLRLTVERRTPVPISFALAELQVFSDQRNVAEGKTVMAPHSIEEGKWSSKFLVDGFDSRNRLSGYQEWLSALKVRGESVREWRDLESRHAGLVDRTVERGVRYGGLGLGGTVALILLMLGRSRVRRRKDLESLRQQIASDFHDDIGSNLSSIALLAELGESEVLDDPEAAREELQEIKDTAKRTIQSMRDIVWMIRPVEETWKEMLARLRETAASLLKAHVYRFDLSGRFDDDLLPLQFKRDFFLIYKEVLNNIVKHAQATRVQIELEAARGRLTLRVTDDGRGFDNLEKGFKEGNGLSNLRRRAHHIGANLKVKSKKGEGTTVQLTSPLP